MLDYSKLAYKLAPVPYNSGGFAATEISIKIDKPSHLTDVLIDKTGAPMAGLWIAFHTKDLTEWHFSTAPTDKAGMFTVESLPPGTYTISYSQNRDGPFTMVTGAELVPEPLPEDEISEATRKWNEYLSK